VTQEDLKKFDKKVRTVKDPFGTGFTQLHRILQEAASQYGVSELELFQLHTSWKAHHN
jgi:hypothetical protein